MAFSSSSTEFPIFPRCQFEECPLTAEIQCDCDSLVEVFCQDHYNLHIRLRGRSRNSFSFINAYLSQPEAESISQAKEILRETLKRHLDRERETTNKKVENLKQLIKDILKGSANRTKQYLKRYYEQMEVLQQIQDQMKVPRISSFTLAKEIYDMKTTENLTIENFQRAFQLIHPRDVIEDFSIDMKCLKLIQDSPLSQRALSVQEKNSIIENADTEDLELVNEIDLSTFSENISELVQVVHFKSDNWEHKRVLNGHSYSVNAIAISGDSKIIASGSYKLVMIWDFKSTEPQRQLKVQGQVLSIAFSPCSKFIAIGGSASSGLLKMSQSGMIIVLEVFSGSKYHLEGHKGAVSSVKYTPCGQFLLTAGYDCKIKLWNSNTREPEFTFTGHSARIFTISVSVCGKYMVSGGWDCDILLWNLNTKQMLSNITKNRKIGRVNCLDFASDKPYFVAASEVCNDHNFFISDGLVSIWNYETGNLVKYFQSKITRLAYFSPGSDYIAAACSDGVFFEIRIRDKHVNYFDQKKNKKIAAAAYSKCGRFLVTGCEKYSIDIWQNY